MLNQSQKPATPATPRIFSPTRDQAAWVRANPGYVRISAARLGQFAKRGTLRADGTFIAESPNFPLHDGNGDFTVGIPVVPKRRR
jgi:hypothetical protein